MDNIQAGVICGATVMLTRFLAVKYKLRLPILKRED